MYDLERYTSLQRRIRFVNETTFDAIALDVFSLQSQSNPIYRKYLSYLYPENWAPKRREQIPFMPISFFKSNIVQTGHWDPEVVFYSSGTTGALRSRHAVRSQSWYHQLAIQTFEDRYGSLAEYTILALLPNYLEQENSSLVNMVHGFMQKTKHSSNGFFIHNFDQLADRIKACQRQSLKFILWGVSYALLDFSEAYPIPIKAGNVIIETGGMKGRSEELLKAELMDQLKDKFNVPMIHSEYGMTELLSQAYTGNDGKFYPASTMRVQIHEINDPLSKEKPGKTGLIQIIDLANIDSCSFIGTDDLGASQDGMSFTVSGRLDFSDLRGCSLLYPSITGV